MIYLKHDGVAPTLSRIVESTNCVLAGQVDESECELADSRHFWILKITVGEILQPEKPAGIYDTVSVHSSDPIAIGFRGIFLLSHLKQRPQIRGSSIRLPAWTLEWGQESAISAADPDFHEIKQYVQRLFETKKAPLVNAFAALRSRSERLRLEAAFDLERYEHLDELFPPSLINIMLSALGDPTYPDAARATLARVISRFPGEQAKLCAALIHLLESGIGAGGFQYEAALLLTRFSSADAGSALRKLITSSNRLIRIQALTALGAFEDKSTVELLSSIERSHPDEAMRKISREILQKRQHQPHGSDVGSRSRT